MDELTCDPNDKLGQPCAVLREEHFRQKKLQVQRLWGRKGLSLLQEDNERGLEGTIEGEVKEGGRDQVGTISCRLILA